MKKNVSLLIVISVTVITFVCLSFSVSAKTSSGSTPMLASTGAPPRSPAQTQLPKLPPTNSAAESAKKSENSIQVIVSGSACPQRHSKPVAVVIEADHTQIPLDYEIELTGPSLQRKICQARITIKGEPGFQYEIREVSQSLLFNVQKKSEMNAEISYGIIGQQEFKIDQDVKEAGEYRHILVKKIINYATPCGKDSILRIQTNIKSTGGGNNKFKSEPVDLHIEKRDCKPEN